MTDRTDQLRAAAEALPNLPGVYMFRDTDGAILYVGKAKKLRSRVLSYFRDEGDGRATVPLLMNQAVSLDFIVTESEIEALVTEANLARAKKPRYNVRLKDDKRYPYIKVTNERYPRIHLTRTLTDDGARYLGPYTDVTAVRRTLKLVQSLFPLRLCREKLPSPHIQRPCLNYQIGKCAGPCCGHVSEDEYNRLVDDAYRFIQGKNRELIHDLERRMKEAAADMQFEIAADLRDRIQAVRSVIERRRAFTNSLLTGDWDVINYAVVDNEANVVVMEIRDGNILGKKDYFLDGIAFNSEPEMLAAFLSQYYLRASFIPPEIHLPHEPDDAATVEELLTEHAGKKCTLVYPMRGEKARLLGMTRKNARLILRDMLRKRDRARESVPRPVLSLKRDLKLPQPPRTIACVDISHLHGTDTVASLVFFRDGKPLKKEYRHFKIKTVRGIDDYASMREVVQRYFSRCVDEQKDLPDLLIVDGGKGQLSSAVTTLRSLGLAEQPVIGLAKRLEEVFIPGSSTPQNIPKTSSSLHLLQRIRDEAHRFAVTYHRKVRGKRGVSSALTEIPGIGPARARQLIERFGSVDGIRSATTGELREIPGIGDKQAETIIAHLGG